MTFKLSRIVVAAGLSIVGTAAIATPSGWHTDPSTYTTGTTDIYLAGSSAVDLALTKFIANTCADNTLDTYRTDAGGKTYYLWTCTSAPSANFKLTSGNTKIAIHKNTNSSSDGVNAVANGAAALAYLQVSDLTANAGACNVAPTVVAATSTIPTYNVFACGTTAGNAGVPQGTHAARFGFADSEPAQFATSNAVVGQLTTVYPLTIIFGVPVSKNVRDALQVSQGLTQGDESEAGMPTLSSAQVNSIFTGNFTSWSDLGLNVAADNAIHVVRRSGGSGTTRAFDATFVGDICVPGAAGLVTASSLVTATIGTQCAAGSTVSLQAGTSDDMAACVASYNNSGAGAIGYLSTDYLPGSADGYRWIKVDGFAPKQLNVANGTWKDWSEESLNYNLKTKLAGDDLAFYNAIKATSGSATLLSEISKNLPQTTSGQWTGGIMGALPTSFNAWGIAAGASLSGRTDASLLAYPANPATRAGNNGYSLCSFPLPTSGYVAQ